MYVFTAVQTKEIFQIISLALTILTSVIIIVSKIVNWYKKAKADGKITKEELGELAQDLSEDIDKIKEDAEEIIEIVEIEEKEK